LGRAAERVSLVDHKLFNGLVINAGSGSRMPRLRQTILLLFLKENFKTLCFLHPF
jgi:hypothetical protein